MIRMHMPHQNLRCWGFRVGGTYFDLCPDMPGGLQLYVNPWPGAPNRRGDYRRWFRFRWLRWLCWLLT